LSEVAGMIETEIDELLLRVFGSVENKAKALQTILDTDVLVDDPEIDSFTIAQLMQYLSSRTVDSNALKSLSDMRLTALQLKQGTVSSSTDSAPAPPQPQSELTLLAPDLTNALSGGNDEDINRAILCMFFEEYDAARLSEVDALLLKYQGEEDELFAELAWKYPEYTNKIVAMSINAAYGEPPSHPLVNNKSNGTRRASFMVFGSRA
jgi:hypothetical protein